ncbi:MAG TPA: tetratricopeptide repeat protein [bacterium]|nr:tetratricopeptide repeat protein [bacterium]
MCIPVAAFLGLSKSVSAFNKGVKLAKAGKYQEAIQETKRSIELDPNFADAHYNLGEFYARTDQKELAIAHYRKYLELSPAATDRQNIGDRIMKLEGKEDTLYYTRGHDLVKDKKFGDAIDQFKKAVKANPNNAAARNSLALCYQETGKLDEALEEFKEVLRIDPGFAQVHYNLGNVYVLREEPEKAVYEYTKAIELDPKDIDAYYNLGSVLSSQGKPGEAAAQYKKILQINPDDTDARVMIDQIENGRNGG